MESTPSLPGELLFAWSVIGVLFGDVIKKTALSGWLIPLNALVGGVLGLLLVGPSVWNFILGMSVGMSSTALHGVGKQLGVRS